MPCIVICLASAQLCVRLTWIVVESTLHPSALGYSCICFVVAEISEKREEMVTTVRLMPDIWR
jgi:hypothetical protein